MHQYFTRAVPSAIAKDSDSAQNGGLPVCVHVCVHACVFGHILSFLCYMYTISVSLVPAGSTSQSPGEKPSSPFDISKIHKVFDDPNIYNNLSPVHSPPHVQDMTTSRYSRHSSRRSSATDDQAPEGRTIPVSGSGYGVKTHSSGSSLVLSNKKESSGQGVGPGQDSQNLGQGVSGQSVVEALDKIVQSSAREIQPEPTVPLISVSTESNEHHEHGDVVGREGAQESTEEDRLLEFEGDSGSELQTNSSVSVDELSEGTCSSVSLPSAQPGLATGQHTTTRAVDISKSNEPTHLLQETVRDVESRSVPSEGVLRSEKEEEAKGGAEGVRRWSEETRRGGATMEGIEGRKMSEGQAPQSVSVL